MEEQKWYMKIGTLGFNFIILNLLWFVFTILGVGIMGLFPATAAIFSVSRDMVFYRDYDGIIKKFINFYFKNLIMPNIIGYFFVILLTLLYFNTRIIQLIGIRSLYIALMSITSIIGIITIIAFIQLFPIFVHFKFKWYTYIKQSYILTIAKPVNTVVIVVLLAINFFIHYLFSVLIFFLGISLTGYIIMKIAFYSFPTTE